MAFFYTLHAPDAELELAQVELAVLSRGRVSGRVGWSAVGVEVTHAAYLGLCVQEVAAGRDLGELVEQIAARQITAEGFAVRLVRRGANGGASQPEICRAVAEVIGGDPNLSRPRQEFCVLVEEAGLHFGPVISQTNHGWQKGPVPQHQLSWALPVRLARALVNLVAVPGDRLVDLCSGAGTVVRQALEMGVEAWGCEVNYKIARLARANLAQLGYEGRIVHRDARELPGEFDAAVVDLPYGHTSKVGPRLHEEILAALAGLAPRAAVVAGEDLTGLLERLGYRLLRSAQVPKGALVRHVHLVATRNEARGNQPQP